MERTERDRVEDYLRINPRAAAEVQAHREVATMLAFTGMDASADLWSKITAEIEADAPAPGPQLAKVFAFDPPTPDTVTPNAATIDPAGVHREHRRTLRRVGTWVASAAAAVVLAVAGAVVITGIGDSASNDPIADAYERALGDRDSVQAELVADVPRLRHSA